MINWSGHLTKMEHFLGGMPMPEYKISETSHLFYLYSPPQTSGLSTFVFFNPLTGDTSSWEGVIAPRLREKGFGTLSFDYRGQTQSPFSPEDQLTTELIVEDSISLMAAVNPENPVFVGLSIGGLFAARAWLAGAAAKGLILINMLRKDGPRLQWIGDALVRAVEIGGLELFRDLYLPLLMNEEWLKGNRENFIQTPASYAPLAADSGAYKLLSEGGPSADWDLPYEKLTLPTLVVTGLQDHVFLEPDVVDELFSRLPRAERINMEDAGHLIPGEQPDKLVNILAGFKA